MSCYDETLPLLQGLTTEQLQALFEQIRQAIINLQLGRREVTVSYAQGDGSKSVTYSGADLAGLNLLLRYVGNALGMPMRRRRAIGVMFS